MIWDGEPPDRVIAATVTRRIVTYRFAYPTDRWRKLALWKRDLAGGETFGVILGFSPDAWMVGVQWWKRGACIQIGPLNVAWGHVEADQ